MTQKLITRCRALLEGNQITSAGYRYTRPAPHVYEYQWLWDSCFHAITYRWFDAAMARDELLSVVAKQVTEGADAGMIPHMTYWQPDGAPLWGVAERSIITQPPLIGVAALRLFEKNGDLSLLEQLYPKLIAYHHWFTRRRDLDGDGLVSIIHPWEAGCDASPRWDLPLGLHNPTPEQSKAARHALVASLRSSDCDAWRLREAGSFCVKALDMNAIRAADLRALAQMARLLDKAQEAAQWQAEAEYIDAAIMAKLFDGERFFDLWGNQPILEDNAAQFVLLFGQCVPQSIAQKLVSTLTSPPYQTPFPVPTTPSNSPHFAPHQYWRGNVWLSVNWLIYSGLKQYGFNELASKLAKRSLALVEQSGFHEYFNPLTGQGYGPALQSWSTIVLDMLLEEEMREERKSKD